MVRLQVLSLVLVASMTISAASSGRAEQDVVSASTLKRTSTVTPTWPQSAAAVEVGYCGGLPSCRMTRLPTTEVPK